MTPFIADIDLQLIENAIIQILHETTAFWKLFEKVERQTIRIILFLHR